MTLPKQFQQLALATLAALAVDASAENYVGTLKIPGAANSGNSSAIYWNSAFASAQGLTPTLSGESGYRLKLGYRYSRYLSVESEFIDVGTPANNIFANPANLASAFRSTGFGVDTIATLPLWRQFSFYGRLGAYRGDPRNTFGSAAVSLLGDSARGTRLRYGLGVRYDFTKALGVHAEQERSSPLGLPVAGEPEADLFSVGLRWRF